MEKLKRNKLYGVLNLAVFVVTVVINVLANTLPLNGKYTGELSDAYPNLFVPAGLTFSIWGVIYLLLAGFVVYQLVTAFSKSGDALPEEKSFIERIGLFFILSGAANSLWIIAWHWEMTFLSLLIMLILFGSLLVIYLRLSGNPGKPGAPDYVFVRLPFSVYLGWITVAVIANVTAVLVRYQWNRFGLGEQFWTVCVLAVVVVITALMLFTRKDIAYSLVVLWAFAGILLKRTAVQTPPDQAVEIAVIAGIAVVSVLVLFTLFRVLLARKKE